MPRCHACGDTLTTPGDPHECWVWTKIQDQEIIHTPCTVCGEAEVNGLRHWRCWSHEG